MNTGTCFITMKDTEIKLRFGIPAARQISEMLVSDESNKYMRDTNLTETGIAHILYYGYANQCAIDDINPVLTKGSFLEFVEDSTINNNVKQIEDACQCFNDSVYTKKVMGAVDNVVDEIKKKKLIGDL